ncbi:hypothetical protein MOO46_07615 (plasmid) [Apilactobacillus apisilvae]|uniref:Uncharacterized protein n=1 Tax=Apilactobacillus apisilvae TaxID=2923364 RepID=A0ABY4PJX9_9LACO|nr:hypothetical protein [Apilactobacillus apisilvae]UQS85852.1 hypothetical protein MOO46_07615 [Apilactobacillus apisilvae]
MSEDKVYIFYGKGVLTLDCIFKGSIILKGDPFNALIGHVLRSLNLGDTSEAFKARFKKNAKIKSFTNLSAEVDVNDPDNSIANLVISSR